MLISWIASSSGVASPGALVSTIRSIVALGVAHDPPVLTRVLDHAGGDGRAGPGAGVALGERGDEARRRAAGGRRRARSRPASRRAPRAPPARRRRCRPADPGSRPRRPAAAPPGCPRCPAPSTTTIRSAPASRAASTGHSSSGRPQSGCSTFGSRDRMRVPRPAAMIRTEGIFMRWGLTLRVHSRAARARGPHRKGSRAGPRCQPLTIVTEARHLPPKAPIPARLVTRSGGPGREITAARPRRRSSRTCATRWCGCSSTSRSTT